jgi:hypothetical protein
MRIIQCSLVNTSSKYLSLQPGRGAGRMEEDVVGLDQTLTAGSSGDDRCACEQVPSEWQAPNVQTCGRSQQAVLTQSRSCR